MAEKYFARKQLDLFALGPAIAKFSADNAPSPEDAIGKAGVFVRLEKT